LDIFATDASFAAPERPAMSQDHALPFDIERPTLEAPPSAGRSVVLSRDQAVPMLELLSSGARPLLGIAGRRRAATGVYRLVPRGELAAGLKSGDLRYARASTGEASTQIIDARGKFAGRADLKAAGPSMTKLIGPAAWQAMAMATQQHYLVEISGKLAAIDGKLDELIARDDDRMLSTFDKARELAAAVQSALAAGEPPSAHRVEELAEQLHRVDDHWGELLRRTRRLLPAYRDGAKDDPAAAVNAAWSLLLRATQALAEVSTAFAALPQPDQRTAETLRAEETARIAARLDDLSDIAGALFLAHVRWQAGHTVHAVNRTNNPVERIRRRVTKSELAKLKAGPGPLDGALADVAEHLSQQAEAPAAMLVDVRDDGTVLVSAEDP
jgi:hypothetical protein